MRTYRDLDGVVHVVTVDAAAKRGNIYGTLCCNQNPGREWLSHGEVETVTCLACIAKGKDS